jgi:hypothetical protein
MRVCSLPSVDVHVLVSCGLAYGDALKLVSAIKDDNGTFSIEKVLAVASCCCSMHNLITLASHYSSTQSTGLIWHYHLECLWPFASACGSVCCSSPASG